MIHADLGVHFPVNCLYILYSGDWLNDGLVFCDNSRYIFLFMPPPFSMGAYSITA